MLGNFCPRRAPKVTNYQKLHLISGGATEGRAWATAVVPCLQITRRLEISSKFKKSFFIAYLSSVNRLSPPYSFSNRARPWPYPTQNIWPSIGPAWEQVLAPPLHFTKLLTFDIEIFLPQLWKNNTWSRGKARCKRLIPDTVAKSYSGSAKRLNYGTRAIPWRTKMSASGRGNVKRSVGTERSVRITQTSSRAPTADCWRRANAFESTTFRRWHTPSVANTETSKICRARFDNGDDRVVSPGKENALYTENTFLHS